MPSDAQTLDQQTKPVTKRRPGRPTTYKPTLGAYICEIYANSAKSLQTICALHPRFPTAQTVYDWLDRFPEFAERYARACAERATFLAEESLEIADNDSRDWEPVYDKDGGVVGVRVDGEHVQRSTLRIKTRQWAASKLNPKRWGDNIGIQVSVGDELRKLVREANAPLDVTPGRIEDKSR